MILDVRLSPPAMATDPVTAAVGYFLVNILLVAAVIRYAFPIIVHADGEDGIEEYRAFRECARSYHRRMRGEEE